MSFHVSSSGNCRHLGDEEESSIFVPITRLFPDITLEEKYQQKFSDVEGESLPLPDIIQPDERYFVQVAVSIPKELDEFPPLSTFP